MAEPCGPIYWELLSQLRRRLRPVSVQPPTQCLHFGVMDSGQGHELILGYYRWQIRIRIVTEVEPEASGATVVAIVAMREAGRLSRLLGGDWKILFREAFHSMSDAGAIGELLARLDRELRDRLMCRAGPLARSRRIEGTSRLLLETLWG